MFLCIAHHTLCMYLIHRDGPVHLLKVVPQRTFVLCFLLSPTWATQTLCPRQSLESSICSSSPSQREVSSKSDLHTIPASTPSPIPRPGPPIIEIDLDDSGSPLRLLCSLPRTTHHLAAPPLERVGHLRHLRPGKRHVSLGARPRRARDLVAGAKVDLSEPPLREPEDARC